MNRLQKATRAKENRKRTSRKRTQTQVERKKEDCSQIDFEDFKRATINEISKSIFNGENTEIFKAIMNNFFLIL